MGGLECGKGAPVSISVAMCSVKPVPFIFRIVDWRDMNRGCGVASCLGCSSAMFAMVLLLILATSVLSNYDASWQEWVGWFGVVVVAFILTGSLLHYLYRSDQDRRTAASTITLEVRQRFSDIQGHASAIEHYGVIADQALQRARIAHEEKRYGEFWEAIEEATKALDTCQSSQVAIAANIDRYVTALDQRVHDFPHWYHGLRPLQDIAPLIRELASLKKTADSSYEFASIREIRATRQDIVGSINKLGETIRHLEGAVTASLNDLRRAVNRSALLRAADPVHLRVVVGFLFSGASEDETASA